MFALSKCARNAQAIHTKPVLGMDQSVDNPEGGEMVRLLDDLSEHRVALVPKFHILDKVCVAHNNLI
jgi:hypothetical protein